MAVLVRCTRSDCPAELDPADHMEEAILRLRAHFRIDHPKKYFDEREVANKLSVYNLDLDEAMANYVGVGWREKLAEGRLLSRNIVQGCQNILRYATQYDPAVVTEIAALSAEHGRPVDDPYANAVADRNAVPDIEYFLEDDPA